MIKTQVLGKNVALDYLNYYLDMERVYLMPMTLGQDAYIVVHGKPSKVVVTDIGIKSIQLSGAWYTWEQLEEMGGVFNTSFDALKSVAGQQ
ncbi:MAG: hypothetical protein IK016_09115 [Lachnospiraceae bacterium]|nr:hypothetical protein [Lachnospiraceae bacterium]